ncbi:MAG: AAA family ATPase [Bacteroides sp.]|nr:AAA family ATPase [Bacteroides sp.]
METQTFIIIVGFAILFVCCIYFFRSLHKTLFVFPRERQVIADELEVEEALCLNNIKTQIANASNSLQSISNPLWKKVQQNLIDNHARSILEEHYLNVRNKLLEREDFGEKYVQLNYESNEEKLSTLFEQRPFVKFDLEPEFSKVIMDAYAKFSSDWFKMVNQSEVIMRYGIEIPFPSFSFGCVLVGNIPIPSFFNNDGDIIYFFPAFVIVLKRDFSTDFYPLTQVSLNVREDSMKFVDYHQPKDSIIIGESWEHSNKDGSRDARYNDNERYLHCKFAHISIAGVSQLFSFEASNYGLSILMSASYRSLQIELLDILDKRDTEKDKIRELRKQYLDQLGVKVTITKTTSPRINDKNIESSIYPVFDLKAADPLFIDAVKWLISTQSVSPSSIQRHFGIGYKRTLNIMEQIEAAGIISSATTTSSNKELEFTIDQFHKWLDFQRSAAHEKTTSNNSENRISKRSGKHYVGEKHPTQPWVWTEYSPGKFDWRKDRSIVSDNASDKLKPQENSSATKELNDLIGLDGVKDEITKLQNFIKIQLIRQSQGLKISPISYHCVFTGNPGTGKTTVARIVAEIYRDMGILKKGHLVETDRSGLVAEYIGQTAVKTNKVIDSALDGVLFVDEAYSLAPSSSNDFGHEAIATLLKRMEDDRDRLVVIIAGYGKEMQTFIDANPGLQSRFNRYIHFDDYSAEDLLAIFELNLKKHQYKMSDSAKTILKAFLDNAVANKDKNFGNGRFVRNIFEKTLQNQATRLSALRNLSKDTLQLITDEDIPTN